MRFLVSLALSDSYVDFILDEIDVLLEMNGQRPADVYEGETARASLDNCAFLIMELPDVATAVAVFKRAVLVKSVYRLFGHGNSYDELIPSIRPEELEAAGLFDAEQPWCVHVEGFGASLSREDQDRHRNLLAPVLHFRGPVRIKPPTNAFFLIEDMGYRRSAGSDMKHVYFGLHVCDGLRDLVTKLDLKSRPYLGPTSLVPELSLLMANQAKIQPGQLVLDPFVGTGSLAIAAAALGAFVVGGDIDIRVLKGKQGRNLATCYAKYGLGVPEVARMDNYLRCYREQPMFHAIITDPPYGVRAGARKSGVDKREPIQIAASQRASIIPATSVYQAVDVMRDLLEAAARNLVLGGRLAYLLPTAVGYTDAELPVHPCLKVVSNSEQKLSRLFSRRLVTMEKVCEYDWSKVEEYRAVSEAHAAAAPSYADIKARINEARTALGITDVTGMAGYVSGFGDATEDSPSPDAAMAERLEASKARRQAKSELNKQKFGKHVPAEDRPVGNAPFDR